MRGHFALESTLAVKILRSLRHPSQPITHLQDWGGLYEVKVWFPLKDLDAVVDEIRYLIELLPNLETYTPAMIAVKFYIVSWCTLSDVFAKLVNAVFDLGIDDRDIGLMMVFRNEHVKKSGLPEILARYIARIKHDDFSRLRNDIVHRGVLKDPELERISARLTHIGLLELFETAKAEEELREVGSDLKACLLRKQTEFTHHLSDTVTMLDEMIEHMVTIFDAKLEPMGMTDSRSALDFDERPPTKRMKPTR